MAFLSGNIDCEKTSELLEKFDDLTVVDLRKEGIRPYNEIPELLGRFEMFVDLKVTKYGLVPTLSMLALQALACGCRVYTFENEVKQVLPERHTPEAAMGKLYDLFLRLNGDRLT